MTSRGGVVLAVLVLTGTMAACDSAPPVIAVVGNTGDPEVARALLDSLHPDLRIRVVGMVGEGSAVEPLEQARKLMSIPGLVAVIGHRDSRSSLVAAQVYNQEGVPHVVPTSTSIRLRDAGRWTYTLVPDDSIEGGLIAAIADTLLHASRVTLFHVADEYGAGIRTGAESALRSRDIEILDVVSYDSGRSSCLQDPARGFELLVRGSVAARGVPDVVILGSRTPDAACIVREFHALDPEISFLAADGVNVGPAFVSPARAPATARTLVVQFWDPGGPPSPRGDFATFYRSLMGTDPVHGHALFADAALLVSQAIREVGPDRAAVRRYLEGLGRDRAAFQGFTGRIDRQGISAASLVLMHGNGSRWTPEG
ncbi:MAG: ABC transporter substrate-binding protein [Gemmatimonadota bacterium]|nr:ABC transporter substrate-binding protein [Gemmatimonadota bacterium]